MKKKALSLLLASTMVVSLTACGGSGDSSASGDAQTSSGSSDAQTSSGSNSSSSGDASSDSSAASGEKADYHEVLADGLTIVVMVRLLLLLITVRPNLRNSGKMR